MRTDRFCAPFHTDTKVMWLDSPETHHILHVKRLGIGNSIVLFNGMGNECNAEIIEINGNKVKEKKNQIKTHH